METLGALSCRTPLWPHHLQRESGGAVAGGQARDPDAEGEAEHGESPTIHNSDTDDFRFFLLLSWQVSMWVQLQIPKIEDGNNFGVAVQVGASSTRAVLACVCLLLSSFMLFLIDQEKVFELLTNTRTKIEAFQTQISK